MYPIILLTQEEMKARWDKDLCYNCDEVYSFEHRCAKIQFYMLKDEEEGDEKEVENTEIMFDNAGELIEVPDPESTPIKANFGSDLVSPMLSLPELEGVEPEPEPEPETKSLVKEIKPPDSEMATDLVRSPEATIEAITEAENTRIWPKPTPNPDPYIPPILPIQIQPWPNKPSINTNPNRPNPWPNKLPKHTITNRPKPWPNKQPKHTHGLQGFPSTNVIDRGKVHTSEFWPQWTKPPIFTLFNLRTSSDESNGLSKDRTRLKSILKETLTSAQAHSNHNANKRRTEQELTVADWVYLGQQSNKQTTVTLGLIFKQAVRGVAYQFLLLHLSSSSTATRIPENFHKIPVSQLMVFPVFDPGDFRSKEDKERIAFEFNGYLGNFGRIFEGNRWRIEENIRWFSEKRIIGIVLEENRRKIEEEVAGLSNKKKKKNWDLASRDFGLVKKKKLKFNGEIRDLRRGIGDFNPRDFGSSMKRELGISEGDIWGFLVKPRSKEDNGSKGFNGVTPNPISKRCRFDASRIGLDGSAFGKPGQTHKWADWAVLLLSIHSALGYLGQQHIWASIAIGLPFQIWAINGFGPLLQLIFLLFLVQLGHYSKLTSLRTRMFSRGMECNDWEIRY